MADNCVFDSVRTVLAVREYQDKPIPDDALHRIVEAGRLSASASNIQPWRFIVVRDPDTIRELGRVVRTGPYIASAPLAIAVAIERDKPTALSDASRAIQSMMLTAWADGVGSNWTGFGSMDQVAELLGVPNSFEVVGVLPFGYPKRKLGLGKKNRKSLSEVASAERFGEPFE
jgi:nitroreductase